MVVIVRDASTAETEQVKGKERHGEEARGEPSNEGNPPTPERNQFLCLLGKFPQHPQKLTSVMISTLGPSRGQPLVNVLISIILSTQTTSLTRRLLALLSQLPVRREHGRVSRGQRTHQPPS